MLHGSASDKLLLALIFSSFIAARGAIALHTVWVMRRTPDAYRHNFTQRTTYIPLGLGLLCTIPTLYVVAHFGPTNVGEMLNGMYHSDPIFGFSAIALTLFAGAYVPIAYVVVTLSIWPAPIRMPKLPTKESSLDD